MGLPPQKHPGCEKLQMTSEVFSDFALDLRLEHAVRFVLQSGLQCMKIQQTLSNADDP